MTRFWYGAANLDARPWSKEALETAGIITPMRSRCGWPAEASSLVSR